MEDEAAGQIHDGGLFFFFLRIGLFVLEQGVQGVQDILCAGGQGDIGGRRVTEPCLDGGGKFGEAGVQFFRIFDLGDDQHDAFSG